MKRVRFISIIVLSIVILSAAHAEVPLILNYQGQVNDVDGLFTGDGYFKFAIVDQAGSTAFWKNDGTTDNSNEPATSVTITGIQNGLFSVKLGDNTNVANMAALTADIFNNNPIFLRVWFSSDNTTFEQLTPDLQLLSNAFAAKAAVAETVDNIDPGVFQRRVTGVCDSGAIKSIDVNGGVECATTSGGVIYTPGQGISIDASNVISLSPNGVTNSNIVNGTILSEDIGSGAVQSTNIAAGAITSGHLGTDAVTATKILNGAVTLAKLASDSVDTSKIVDGSITATDLAVDSLTTSAIQDEAITSAKLAPDSVDASKIVDGTITATDLAVASVATSAIQDGAITAAKLASDLAGGIVSIPGAAFRSTDISTGGGNACTFGISPSSSFFYFTSAPTGGRCIAIAPINIPNNAVITEFSCYMVDNSVNHGVQNVDLYRVSLNSTAIPVAIASAPSPVTDIAGATSNVQFTNVTAINHPVTNSTYSYYMYIRFQTDTSGAVFGSSLNFRGCSITYQ